MVFEYRVVLLLSISGSNLMAILRMNKRPASVTVSPDSLRRNNPSFSMSSKPAGLEDMEKDGLLRRNESGLTVTDAGRLFIRNIAMRFDPEIESSSTTRYSKTI